MTVADFPLRIEAAAQLDLFTVADAEAPCDAPAATRPAAPQRPAAPDSAPGGRRSPRKPALSGAERR